jgi:hypothetical protein
MVTEDSLPKAEFERLLERRLQKQSSKHAAELAALDQQTAELTAQIQTLQAELEQRQAQVPQRDYEAELKAAKVELENARTSRSAAEQKARLAERNAALRDALLAADCVDLDGGRRYFLSQIEHYNDKWMFRDLNNQLVPITDGVRREIPKSLRKPSMSFGGSGSIGGLKMDDKRNTDLEREQAKLDQLAADYKKRPSDLLAGQLYHQQQKVKALKKK